MKTIKIPVWKLYILHDRCAETVMLLHIYNFIVIHAKYKKNMVEKLSHDLKRHESGVSLASAKNGHIYVTKKHKHACIYGK